MIFVTRPKLVHLTLAVVASIVSGVVASPLHAQFRPVPQQDYYVVFDRIYYDGEYRTAERAFTSAGKGGLKFGQNRWIDSICYFTMLGECHYQMGNLAGALELYTSALQLYLANQDWMNRMRFPATVDVSNRVRRPVTWTQTQRQTRLARVPDRIQFMQGSTVDSALRQGGVVTDALLYSVGATEVARCTAIALARRKEIMGPICEHDPLSNSLQQALAARPAPANHWSQSWISCLLGLAYASTGRDDQAIAELQRSLVMGANLDHELTSLALLELGKLAYKQKRFPQALVFFNEATITGSHFAQFDVVAEAFQWGAKTHQVSGGQGVWPPLAAAARIASRNWPRVVEAEIYLSTAVNLLATGDASGAASMIKQGERVLRRRDMARGVVGARYLFHSSQALFLGGNFAEANKAFADAIAIYRTASKWNYQIALADKFFTAGAFTTRTSGLLFDQVLREPTDEDWARETLESLTTLLTPHGLAMEHWFELALQNREVDKALLISDRIRRARFYNSLPMGGRLLSLRWILNAPVAALSESDRLRRQSLLASYPKYAELSNQVEQCVRQLKQASLVPEGQIPRDQAALWNQLDEASVAQELMLGAMALSSTPSNLVFPPNHDINTIQQALQPGQVVLSFLNTSRGLYAFSLSRERYDVWRIEAAKALPAALADLLRAMGNYDRNAAVSEKELNDASWKDLAAPIFAELTNKATADQWAQIQELIVVPDGLLWYLPFEAMPVGVGADAKPLLSQMKLRYLPTVGLVVPDQRGQNPLAQTAVVTGRLFGQDTDQVQLDAYERIQQVLPGSYRLTPRQPVPGRLLSTVVDRVVLLDDLAEPKTPLQWSPLPSDRKSDSLAEWMQLPFGAPEHVLIPGYHSFAENALKRGGNGNELFMTACALMASGTRSILISRWRVAGQTTRDLMREYAQELPNDSAMNAWRRSVELLKQSDLLPSAEPRVKELPTENPLKADHPFFWSGYMLIDSTPPPKQDAE